VEIYGRHAGYGFAGLGVSTAIGNFTQTTVDLPFPPGLLGLLDWQRTYNSHSGAVGALGPGWSTSLSARLVATSSGLLHQTAGPVTFYDEDGRVLTFTPDGGGGYASPQDLNANLARNADGSFTLAYTSGLVWSFNASGQLTGRSLEGQQVTLDYDGDELLRAAHAPSGRSLSFSYDANRRLTSVEASDGRKVTFAYGQGDVTSSLLDSVTVPGGGVTSIEWSGTGQEAQISQIANPDGNLVVAMTYQEKTRRVMQQTFAGGGIASFGYDDTTGVTTVTAGPSGASATFQANAGGKLVKMTDGAGNAAAFSYSAGGYLAEAVTPGGTSLAQTHDARGNLLTSTWGGARTAWTFDDLNRVTSMTNQVGGITRYAYAGGSHIPAEVTSPDGGITRTTAVNGLVTSRTDADGGTTGYSFDAGGNLVSATGPLGEITRFGYDGVGNRTQMTAPSGATSQWAFDGAGRVTRFTGPDGAVTGLRYSAAGLLQERTGPDGGTVRYGYDAAGNLTSFTDELGNQTTFGFDAEGNPTSFADALGHAVTFGYDVLGRLVNVADAEGSVARYGYDADGNNTVQEGPGGTVRADYDARGNPIAVTDLTSAVWRYGYDAADRLTEFTNPVDGSWQIGYDVAGNVASVTDPSAAQARWEWTGAGRLAAITDPVGRPVSFARDAAGRVTQITNAEGGVTRYVYDSDGRRIAVTTPAGLLTRYEYDDAGRLVAIIDPRGWVSRTEYDSRGLRTAVIRPSGAVSRFGYDPAGQLTEMTDPNGSVTRYTYDGAGRIIAVTDPKNAVTRYAYDGAGRLVSLTDPLGQSTQCEYDKAGNLTAITDPSGHTQHFAYDGRGGVTSWTADDGSEVTFTYDKAGRRASMTDATGTTHYGYDPVGRIVTVTGPDGGQVKTGYDRAGQRTSLTYPSGLTVGYSYDLNGRLTGLRDSRAGDAVYALDPDGRLLTEQLPHRLARRYHYENGSLNRFLVIRDGHPVAETALTHDPDGRILTQRAGETFRSFRYDPAGQLTGAELHDGDRRDELHLVYDAAGNRVSLRRGQAETRYRYDAACQLEALEADGRHTEFRYDSSGRLTEEIEGDRRCAIRYNGFGWPVEVTRERGDQREVTAATFNGDGLLAGLTLTNQSERREEEKEATVRYRWSVGEKVPQILAQRAEPAADDAERDEPGRLDADFAYGYGREFADWEGGAGVLHRDVYASQLRTEDTEPWSQARDYEIFGAPAERSRRGEEPRRNGEPRHRGEPHHGEGPHRNGEPPHRAEGPHRGGEPPRGAVPPPELPRFGYHGELALGPLVYLRSRVYDAGLGRFTTRDPLLTGGPRPGRRVNPYVYAGNDPVNFTDPLGTFAIIPPVTGSVTGAVQHARSTMHQTILTSVVSMLAAGNSSDHTTLHIAARIAGFAQLVPQLANENPPGALRAADMEYPVERALKNGIPEQGEVEYTPQTGRGDIDILITVGLNANVWEVKGTGKLGPYGLTQVPGLAQLAQKEAIWYSQAYNNQYRSTGTVARPGEPMDQPAFVAVEGWGTLFVWSALGFRGDVVYQLISRDLLDFDLATNPQELPVYVYDPKTEVLNIPEMSPAALAGVAPLLRTGLEAAGITAGGALAVAGAGAILEQVLALLARLAPLFAG
jgi:RHS repeat-associated protein